MITIKEGDIMEAREYAIVNPVNCEGFMGKGLALLMKRKYPHNFLSYKNLCNNKKFYPGGIFINLESGKLIINLATKDQWRNPSQYKWIIEGLHQLRAIIIKLNIKSVAMPAIGAGLGGLNWEKVKILIFAELEKLDCAITIYLTGDIARMEKE